MINPKPKNTKTTEAYIVGPYGQSHLAYYKGPKQKTKRQLEMENQGLRKWVALLGAIATFLLVCLLAVIFGCNENPSETPQAAVLPKKALGQPVPQKVAVQAVKPLSEVSKGDVPQRIGPEPIPLVGPTDENWLAALRIDETKENDWNVSDVGKLGGPSKGCYAIQEGRWNDGLDRIGIDHDDPEWCWDLWYWCRPKAEYVLYAYWARFKLKTWEQRIKAHKGIKEINNPSRKVYYERVRNIAYDLMRRQ